MEAKTVVDPETSGNPALNLKVKEAVRLPVKRTGK